MALQHEVLAGLNMPERVGANTQERLTIHLAAWQKTNPTARCRLVIRLLESFKEIGIHVLVKNVFVFAELLLQDQVRIQNSYPWNKHAKHEAQVHLTVGLQRP